MRSRPACQTAHRFPASARSHGRCTRRKSPPFQILRGRSKARLGRSSCPVRPPAHSNRRRTCKQSRGTMSSPSDPIPGPAFRRGPWPSPEPTAERREKHSSFLPSTRQRAPAPARTQTRAIATASRAIICPTRTLSLKHVQTRNQQAPAQGPRRPAGHRDAGAQRRSRQT